MKSIVIVSAALVVAGCATDDKSYLAQKECKVAPVTTTSVTEPRKVAPVSSLRQREAEMDLATSRYRFAQLQRNPVPNNTIEDALYDCEQSK